VVRARLARWGADGQLASDTGAFRLCERGGMAPALGWEKAIGNAA
jgi:hypothetical protein